MRGALAASEGRLRATWTLAFACEPVIVAAFLYSHRHVHSPSDDTQDETRAPSKMQLKREDEAMQALGRRLVALSKVQIAEFPVSEALRDALLEWKRISSHEAQRRHIKRIGKLVREHDPEEIALAMDRVDPNSSLSMVSTRTAQRWCGRLLSEGNPALTEFVDQHPGVEAQRLRQLIRKAKPDAQADKPTAATRALLRFVRQQVIAVAR